MPTSAEPDLSKCTSTLLKKTPVSRCLPRARFSKPRPNIGAALNKASKVDASLATKVFETSDKKEVKANDPKQDVLPPYVEAEEENLSSTVTNVPTTSCNVTKNKSTDDLTLNLNANGISEEESKNVKDSSSRCGIQYQDAFQTEGLSMEKVKKVTDSLAKNVLNSNKKRSIAEKTSKPRKKFASHCKTPSASENTLNKRMPNRLMEDSSSSSIANIEESVDDPSSYFSEEDILQHSKNNLEVPIDNGSPTTEISGTIEDSPLKNISNPPRKRVTSKRTRKQRRRLTRTAAVPHRSEMKMIDLIFCNPDGAPMKYANSQVSVEVEEKTKESTSPPEESTEPSAAPRVIIGENGEIIIDEASLVVQRNQKDFSSTSVLVENENTTYSSFRKKLPRKWSRKETIKFYKALSLVGTDFALMEIIFNDTWKIPRTRHELKLKFKREERNHAKLVFQAMYESQACDISILDDDSDDIIDSSEDEDDPPQNENTDQNDVKKKENGAETPTDTQDQSVNDETENKLIGDEQSTSTEFSSSEDETG